MEKNINSNNNTISITMDVNPIFSFALYQNHVSLLRSLVIKNNSSETKEDVVVKIEDDSNLFSTFEKHIALIEPGEEKYLKNFDFKILGSMLFSLTERMTSLINVSVFCNDEILGKESKEIIIFAYDQWPGSDYDVDIITCFVTPNNPVIKQLMLETAGILGELSENSSLDGYQKKDPERIIMMAKAAYKAIKNHGIIYSEPPASYKDSKVEEHFNGQRIRLADELLDNKLGTCFDMSLLYASLLEAIRLKPIIILMKAHAFVGLWLFEDSEAKAYGAKIDDPSELEKRMADGINELILVECTAMCSGSNFEFEEAADIAKKNIANYDEFECAIDVMRARKGGVLPLPQRIKNENYDSEIIEKENLAVEEFTGDIDEKDDSISVSDYEVNTYSKVEQWEHKLLDLSVKNSLINMKVRSVLPILVNKVAKLEDSLSDGDEFIVVSRPEEWNQHCITKADFETINNLGPYANIIDMDMERKRLHSWLAESSLQKDLTKLYRTSKIANEENGASTLYLTIGLLKWTENSKSKKAYYAPILLVPIEIIRKSALKGYVIKKREEDVQINITLFEFLKNDFGITFEGLNPLPMDEHGVDVDKILTIIRKAIVTKRNWNVIESSFIGNLSFTQFLMWNDLHNHLDSFENNNIISALINGTMYKDECEEHVQTDNTYIPVAADSSQIKAINMAAAGESFILHGPPGTGKSQTITAMISNAITNGKTVLFVAEKMAALEVVQRRLSLLGIGDFCLEIHSNKAIKKNVLNSLQKIVELKVWGMASDYNEKLEEIQSMREKLNSYVKSLYAVQNFGLSIKEMIERYEVLPECNYDIRFDEEWIQGLDVNSIEVHKRIISNLIKIKNETIIKDAYLFDLIEKTDYTQSFRGKLEDALFEYEKILESYSEKGCDKIEKITNDFQDDKYSLAMNYDKHRSNFINRRNQLESKWSAQFIDMNVGVYVAIIFDAEKKIIGRKKKIEEVIDKIQPYAKIKLSDENLKKELSQIIDYKNDYNSFLKFESEIDEEIKVFYQQGGTADQIEQAFKLRNEVKDVENKLFDLLVISNNKVKKFDVENRKQLCKVIRDNIRYLKSWIIYKQQIKECTKAGLGELINYYTDDVVVHDFINNYLKLIYKAVISLAIENEDVLNQFEGVTFDSTIEEYKRIENEFLELTREEMYYKLTHQIPTGYESEVVSKELAILKKAIHSGGRGMSLRSLFEQIPHIIVKLCPCLLMSPISVAQYLSTDNDLFDIVIFDEASQLPTCKAVGVIARGKSTVIVGDPKQMPPTSFFTNNYVDDENIMFDDLDSILEDCLAISMPECHLKWHYRSKHESLIAFSNREFYDNNMLTFPSVNDREKRVRLITVNGRFNRKKGRVNEREGRKIVDEIIRRYRDPMLREKSIGVVTFNIGQQGLIEDMLAEEFKNDSEFDSWANEKEEPLFVKNLENVQGDERDTIMFSVSYGPDEDERLSLNFGPLNKEGGWKRLNVAVSRARKEMLVFSSMTPEMIDLNKTKSKGVEGLRDFLLYARDGRLVEVENQNIQKELKGIQKSICLFLNEHGYECRQDIGRSDFKVDIAVCNPMNESEYILGILLDGEYYRKSADSAKDREISQPDILKDLGWNLFRIWTIDWWDEKDLILDKLLRRLQSELDNYDSDSNNSKTINDEPKSEEIVYDRSNAVAKKRGKGRNEKQERNMSFEDVERFSPISEKIMKLKGEDQE